MVHVDLPPRGVNWFRLTGQKRGEKMGFNETNVLKKMRTLGFTRKKSATSELFFVNSITGVEIYFGRDTVHVGLSYKTVFKGEHFSENDKREIRKNFRNKMKRMFPNHPVVIYKM